MKVSFFVAKRYLWSEKSHQLIQLISWISLASILVCTAALFIVLSVFNGLQSYIGSRFNAFHADVEITASKGKTFALTEEQLAALRGLEGVEYLSEVCSDMAVLSYDDRQFIARLKGVAPDYYRMKRLDTTVYKGVFATESGDFPLAVLGAGVEQKLHCGIADYISNRLLVHYPKRSQRFMSANPLQGIQSEQLTPVGCFYSATDYDASYVFTSLPFMQRLTGHEGEVTSVELRVSPKVPVRKVAASVEALLGNGYQVLDQYQQEAEMYKVMKSEKWAIFAILSFILLIASFNMIGIRKVFVQEGLLIAGVGTLAGMLLGFAVCWVQKTFHIVRLGAGGTPYPVEIHGMDMLAITAVVLCITLPAMLIPVIRISEHLFKNIRHE